LVASPVMLVPIAIPARRSVSRVLSMRSNILQCEERRVGHCDVEHVKGLSSGSK
jgi:hypothetical protein